MNNASDDDEEVRKPAAANLDETYHRHSVEQISDNIDGKVSENTLLGHDTLVETVVGELPFLVTHWLSGYSTDGREILKSDEEAAALLKIRKATADLALAFTTLGAFGKSTKPSLCAVASNRIDGITHTEKYQENTRNASYADLKRSWPFCGTKHLNMLLKSAGSVETLVHEHSQNAVIKNFVYSSKERLSKPTQGIKSSGGRMLNDSGILGDDIDPMIENRTVITALNAPIIVSQKCNDFSDDNNPSDPNKLRNHQIKLMSKLSDVSQSAATSMRQHIENRLHFVQQDLHIRSLKKSLMLQSDSLIKFGQRRSKLLASSQSNGRDNEMSPTSLVVQLDEIKVGEQSCERVIAQLQRQIQLQEQSFLTTNSNMSTSQLQSLDDFKKYQYFFQNFRDPLQSAEPSNFGRNSILFNTLNRQIGVDRHFSRGVPRAMGRIRNVESTVENRKALLYHRMSHAATINTHLSYPVYCLRFDRTGHYFITGADDYLVKVFCVGGNIVVKKRGRIDPNTYARGAVLVCTLKGHAGVINDIGVSSDNSFLATASEDGDCRVWGLKDGCPIAILRGHVGGANMVSWSTLTPYRLVTTGADGLARTWDIREACLNRYNSMIGRRPEYRTGICSRDASRRVDLNADSFSTNRIDVLQIPSLPQQVGDSAFVGQIAQVQGIPLPPLPLPDAVEEEQENRNVEDSGRFVANDNLDDGVKLVSRYQHGATIDERHVGPGTRARRSAVKVICVARCPLGGQFATGSDDGICRVWQDEDDSFIEEIDNSFQQSKDSKQHNPENLSSNLPLDKLLVTLQGHLSAITDLHYSSKGDRLITASQKDGVVRIWTWNADAITRAQSSDQLAVKTSDENRARTTSHILLKLTNPHASTFNDVRQGPRARPNRTHTSPISCDVAVWSHDDTKIVTSQCEIAKQSTNEIVPGSQYLFLWDSFNGYCLLGIPNAHKMACPVVLPHPFLSSIVCSAGADGIVKLWDWETGKCFFSHENIATFGPIEANERGKNVGYLDGDFSPDGTTLIFSDESGRVTVLDVFRATGDLKTNGLSDLWSCAEWMQEQYFSNDYYDLFYDSNGYCVERGSELPPHIAPRGSRCSHSGAPFSAQVNDAFKGLIGPTPIDEKNSRWNRNNIRLLANQSRNDRKHIHGNIVRQYDSNFTTLFEEAGIPIRSKFVSPEARTPETHRSRTASITDSGRHLSSNYRWSDYNDIEFGDDDQDHETDDEDFQLHETVGGRIARIVDSDSDDMIEMDLDNDTEPTRSSSRGNRRKIIEDDESSQDEYVEYVSTNNAPSGSFISDYDLHFFRMMTRDEGNSVKRSWLRRNESFSSFEGRKKYTPQVGDSVVYIPRAHQNTLAAFPGVQTPPWQQWPEEAAWPLVLCCIRNIRYRFPYKAYHKELTSVVARLTLEIVGIPELSTERIFGWPSPSFTTLTRSHVFELALFDNKEDDFIIPFGLYTSRLRNLENVLHESTHEVRVEAFYADSNDRSTVEDPAYVSFIGRVLRCSDNFDDEINSPNLFGSGFNSLAIVWDDGSDHDPDQVSPWDVSVHGSNKVNEVPQRPKLTDDEKKRVRDTLRTITRMPGVDEYFLYPVDVTKYSDYATRVEVPMDLTFMMERLDADYYSTRLSVATDMMLIYYNCQKYNGDTDELSDLANEMCKTFEGQVLDDDERLLLHKYDKPIVEQTLQDSLLVSGVPASASASGRTTSLRRTTVRSTSTVRSSLENVQGSAPKVKRGQPKRGKRKVQSRQNTRVQRPTERSVLETSQPQAVQTLEQLSSGRGQRTRGRVTRSNTATSLSPAGQSMDPSGRVLRNRGTFSNRTYADNERSDVEEEESADHASIRHRRNSRNSSRQTTHLHHPSQSGSTRVSSRLQVSVSGSVDNRTSSGRRQIVPAEELRQRVPPPAAATRRSRRGSDNDDEIESATVATSQRTRRSTTIANDSEFSEEFVNNRSRVNKKTEATKSTRSTRRLPDTKPNGSNTGDHVSSTTRPLNVSHSRRLKSEVDSDFDDEDADESSESEDSQSSDSSQYHNSHVTSRRSSRTMRKTSLSPTKADETHSRTRGKQVHVEPSRSSPSRKKRVPSSYLDPSSSEFSSDDNAMPDIRSTTSSKRKRKEVPVKNGKAAKKDTEVSPNTSASKKMKTNGKMETQQVEKWPEIPLKRISEVTLAMLNELRKLDELDIFLLPVAESYPEIKDVYLQEIHHPMDFRTIEEERLWYYQSINELQSDLLLTFTNCLTYNEPDSPMYQTACEMIDLLESKFREVCKNLGIRLRPSLK